MKNKPFCNGQAMSWTKGICQLPYVKKVGGRSIDDGTVDGEESLEGDGANVVL